MKIYIKIAKIEANIDDETINKLDLTDPEKLYKYMVKHKLYSYYNKNRQLQNLKILHETFY